MQEVWQLWTPKSCGFAANDAKVFIYRHCKRLCVNIKRVPCLMRVPAAEVPREEKRPGTANVYTCIKVNLTLRSPPFLPIQWRNKFYGLESHAHAKINSLNLSLRNFLNI